MQNWTVLLAKETDIALRSFLSKRGMKKGALSKFVEEAVKWRVLEQTAAEAGAKFSDLPPEDLSELIGKAVTAARQTNTRRAG